MSDEERISILVPLLELLARVYAREEEIRRAFTTLGWQLEMGLDLEPGIAQLIQDLAGTTTRDQQFREELLRIDPGALDIEWMFLEEAWNIIYDCVSPIGGRTEHAAAAQALLAHARAEVTIDAEQVRKTVKEFQKEQANRRPA